MIINPFNKTKNQSNYEQIKDSTDKIKSGSTWVNFVKGSYTNLNKSNSTNLNRLSSGNISNSSIYTNLAFGIICINNQIKREREYMMEEQFHLTKILKSRITENHLILTKRE